MPCPGDAVPVTDTPGSLQAPAPHPGRTAAPVLSVSSRSEINTTVINMCLQCLALNPNQTTYDDHGVQSLDTGDGTGGSVSATLPTYTLDQIADYLTGLGASRIVSREEMLDDPGKPMESGVWDGCIDCVGGQILARAIKQMNYGCGIASLGNTAGVKMEASIIPFLLRGVAVLGIDSVMVPVAEREKIWAALDAGMPRDVLESMAEEIGLADVPEYGKKILEGKVRGRILVNVNK